MLAQVAGGDGNRHLLLVALLLRAHKEEERDHHGQDECHYRSHACEVHCCGAVVVNREAVRS